MQTVKFEQAKSKAAPRATHEMSSALGGRFSVVAGVARDDGFVRVQVVSPGTDFDGVERIVHGDLLSPLPSARIKHRQNYYVD